jgi:hypothetical protein
MVEAAILGLTTSPAALALACLAALAAGAHLLLAVLLKRLDRPEEAFGRKLSFKAHKPRKSADGADGGGFAEGACGDGD